MLGHRYAPCKPPSHPTLQLVQAAALVEAAGEYGVVLGHRLHADPLLQKPGGQGVVLVTDAEGQEYPGAQESVHAEEIMPADAPNRPAGQGRHVLLAPEPPGLNRPAPHTNCGGGGIGISAQLCDYYSNNRQTLRGDAKKCAHSRDTGAWGTLVVPTHPKPGGHCMLTSQKNCFNEEAATSEMP